MKKARVGIALCGSYCTFEAVFPEFEHLAALGYDLTPIMSENARYTDTRFGRGADFAKRLEALCKKTGDMQHKRRRAHRPQEAARYTSCRALHRKYPRKTRKRHNRLGGYHVGQIPSSKRQPGGSRNLDQRCARSLGPQYRKAAKHQEFLFRSLRAGRCRKQAGLDDRPHEPDRDDR